MLPADLGLPAKFAGFRRGQEDLVLDIGAGDRRFTLLSAPTGSGKSIVYTAVGSMLGGRTLILTRTKGLQLQLTGDFAGIGMVDIRGLSNYRCLAVDPDGELAAYGPGNGSFVPCSDGPCHAEVACSLREGGCSYYDAVRIASESSLVVTNYSYWMSMNRFAESDKLGVFDLLIPDEAHAAPDALAEFCSIEIERSEVRSLLGLDLPTFGEDDASWVDWARSALDTCRDRWTAARAAANEVRGDRRKAIRTLKRIGELGRSLKELANAASWQRSEQSDPNVWLPSAQIDWVQQRTPTGVRFTPVWAHSYAEQYLFRGIPRVILASATLQRQTARYLGITESQFDFVEAGSNFDVSRRRLTYIPTTNVDARMVEGQVRMWVNRIDAIIAGRPEWKGIVHTRSYARAEEFVTRSRNQDRLISHTSRTAREAVAAYRESARPVVLVSPSVDEGYDFPYDDCRFQVLAKVPFADNRDPLMQARSRSDKTYLDYLAAQSIIQQVGRGTRAEDDWCESFIVDDHMDWFWPVARKQGLWPAWFQRAYRVSNTVPHPQQR